MIPAVNRGSLPGLSTGHLFGGAASVLSIFHKIAYYVASLIAFGVLSLLAFLLLIPSPAYALQNKAVGPITVERGEVVDHDISTGYGRIKVEGEVDGDVMTGSGNVLIYGPVDGDVKSGVGNIEVKAPVDGDISASFGDVEINEHVTGDVDVERGDVFLGPEARIDGNIFCGNGSYDTAPGAQIGGEVRFGPASDMGQVASETNGEDIEEGLDILGVVGWMLATALFIGITVLLAVMMPRSVGTSARMIGAMPGRSALVGLGSVAGAFVLFAVLLVSGIGIPLLILLVPVYLALVVFGAVVFAYFLGRKLVFLVGGYRHGNALAAVAGAVIVALAALLPLGGILMGFLALLGTGAAILAFVSRPRAGGFRSYVRRSFGKDS